MAMRRKSVQCTWDNCALEFENAIEYRRHCAAHIQAQLAAAGFQINLPTETWSEVLPSCGRKSLAKRVGLSQRLFHAISRPLLDGPKGRILPEMTFARSNEDKTILFKIVRNGDSDRVVVLPIAQVAPPENVAGFQEIKLTYFDTKVLSFLCTIRALLQNIRLELYHHHNNLATLECLLRAIPRFEFAIVSLHIRYGVEADLLGRLLFSNVRHLRIDESIGCLSDGPRKCSTCLPILVKWLHLLVGDGHQKLASLYIGNTTDAAELVSQAKKHFLSVNSTPVPYIVAFSSYEFRGKDHQWPLRNKHNEMLTLRYYNPRLSLNGRHYNFVLFRRSSTSEETELLTVEEAFESALFSEEPSRNKLSFNVNGMGAIDECVFHIDSENTPQDDEEGDEPGPSNAKQ